MRVKERGKNQNLLLLPDAPWGEATPDSRASSGTQRYAQAIEGINKRMDLGSDREAMEESTLSRKRGRCTLLKARGRPGKTKMTKKDKDDHPRGC